MEDLKEARTRMMKNMAMLLLKASGADIVPPTELQAQAIRALDLENDKRYDKIEVIFNQTLNKEKRLQYVRALILTQLTPSQMMGLHEIIQDGVNATMQYVHDHPECKEGSVEDAFKGMFDIDDED